MNKVEIGSLLQARRENLALNQNDLAEMTGITIKTIYLIEQGRGNPSLNTLQQIATVLGLEIGINIKSTGV